MMQHNFYFVEAFPTRNPWVSKGSFIMSNAECIAAAERNYRE
jgi:redox-sensitive bicupin YhaK (pirin superfamily)